MSKPIVVTACISSSSELWSPHQQTNPIALAHQVEEPSTASSADDGAQSLKRWPSLAKIPSRCRSTRPRSKLIVVPQAEKGGAQSGDRPLARWPHDKNPCAERSALPAGRPSSDPTPGCRYPCSALCSGARPTHGRTHRRQRL